MVTPKLFIFDIDGSFRNSSMELNAGLSNGFSSLGQRYPFTAKQVWNLSGIGNLKSRLKLIESLYTINLLKKDVNHFLMDSDSEEMIKSLVKNNLNDADHLKIGRIFRISQDFSKSMAARKMVELFPFASGSVDLLKSRNYETAIFTNSSIETLRRDLAHMDLGKFSTIISGESSKYGKPSGEGIKKIMALIGFNPEETMCVGDSVSDIRAAKDAGCSSAALLCGSGLSRHLEIERPDHIFKNIWDLSKHFSNTVSD